MSRPKSSAIAGIALRVIQEISGHRSLEELQRYLQVTPEQVRGAVSALSLLSHEGGEYVGKYHFIAPLSHPLSETCFLQLILYLYLFVNPALLKRRSRHGECQWLITHQLANS